MRVAEVFAMETGGVFSDAAIHVTCPSCGLRNNLGKAEVVETDATDYLCDNCKTTLVTVNVDENGVGKLTNYGPLEADTPL